MEYKFTEPEHTACIVCSHILHDNALIEYVTHDDADGVWQFICGSDHHEVDDIKTRPLSHIVDIDLSVNEVANLELGKTLYRSSKEKHWQPFEIEF